MMPLDRSRKLSFRFFDSMVAAWFGLGLLPDRDEFLFRAGVSLPWRMATPPHFRALMPPLLGNPCTFVERFYNQFGLEEMVR